MTLENLASAAALFVGFVGALFVLRKIVPGPLRQGQPLRDGTRKTYKLNGFSLLLILAATLALGQLTGWFTLVAVHRLFWPLLVVANLFAFAHTGWLFARGRRRRAAGAADAGLGHDLWFGPELNPELGGIDLKMFAYIPSLMGLWVLNLSFAATQWHELGHLTTRMALYQAFFTVYIFNYFQFEYGMLHTWDVIAENFGFMLVWGDYVVVPFFYCIGGWYLARNLDPMPPYEVAALIALFVVGFWLFRGSNEQKHRYKEDPRANIWGRPAETVGGKLLVSGFWGIGRKLNYTGELMVYFSWTICTGFYSLVPYLLPLWLVGLFTHRAWRDEQRCHAKYGALWDEYCQRARFRMIPFLY
jgi:delta14-sterol reductase